MERILFLLMNSSITASEISLGGHEKGNRRSSCKHATFTYSLINFHF